MNNNDTYIYENCEVNIDTEKPNPFIVSKTNVCWNSNELILSDPYMRVLAGVSPLDRGFAHSSKYVTSLHQHSCYKPLNMKMFENDVLAPLATHAHS